MPGAPPATPANVDNLWPRLLAHIEGRSALAWLRNLELRSIDGEKVVLAPRPGHREMLGFATPPRLASLEPLFAELLGRPVKITIESAAEAGSTSSSNSTGEAPAGARPGLSVDARRKAMNLPLVKQVLQEFDATIVDIREEKPRPATPPPAPPPATGAESSAPAEDETEPDDDA